MLPRDASLNAESQRGAAPFREHLQRGAPQDRGHRIAHLPPHIAHRAWLLASAGGIGAFLEAVDRVVIALDDLDYFGHGNARWMARQHVAAAGTLLAGGEGGAL